MLEQTSSRILFFAFTLTSTALAPLGCGGRLDSVPDAPGRAAVDDGAPSSPPASPTSAPPSSQARDAGVDGGPPPPAGFADGVCVAGDVTLGLYDPDCVYIEASTVYGLGGHGAVFHPEAPTRLAHAFGNPRTSAKVRPDRRIVFTSLEPSGVYELVPGVAGESVEAQYARHVLLPTPACSGPALRDVYFRPIVKAGVATGFYTCYQNGAHLFEIGTATPFEIGQRAFLAIDEHDAVLASQTAAGLFIEDGGVTRPVAGVAEHQYVASRSRRGGGFLVISAENYELSPLRLHDLDAKTGTTTVRGAYQKAGYDLRPLYHMSTMLEPSGALVAIVSMPGGSRAVVRFRTDRAPEMLYDEAKSPTGLKVLKLVSGT